MRNRWTLCRHIEPPRREGITPGGRSGSVTDRTTVWSAVTDGGIRDEYADRTCKRKITENVSRSRFDRGCVSGSTDAAE